MFIFSTIKVRYYNWYISLRKLPSLHRDVSVMRCNPAFLPNIIPPITRIIFHVHTLPTFVSFEETQIVCIHDVTEWLNFDLETDFYQTLFPFLYGKTSIYFQVFILVQYILMMVVFVCLCAIKFDYICNIICAASSKFVSSSILSWQILTAHAQPFRRARDLAFCLKVPLDSLLVWAGS